MLPLRLPIAIKARMSQKRSRSFSISLQILVMQCRTSAASYREQLMSAAIPSGISATAEAAAIPAIFLRVISAACRSRIR